MLLDFRGGAVYIAKDKSLKNSCLGFACLLLAAGSYQVCIPMYIYVVMTFIFMKNGCYLNKRSLMEYIRACFWGAAAIIGNIIITKMIIKMEILSGSSRVGFEGDILTNILKPLIKVQKTIWFDGYSLFPKGVLLFVLLAYLCYLGYVLLRRRKRVVDILCMIGCVFTGYVINCMAGCFNGSGFSMTVRVAVPIFGIFTVLIWLIAEHWEFDCKENSSVMGNLLIVFSGLFLVYNIWIIQCQGIDVIMTNSLDKAYISQIQNKIETYEKMNSQEVKKVGFLFDDSPTYKYYGYIKYEGLGGGESTKAFATDWSNIMSLNYYTGRSYTKIDVPEDIVFQVIGKDWVTIDTDEQIFFRGDECFIAVY